MRSSANNDWLDLSKPKMKFGVIDLFSGAGGMTLGFKEAGFEPLLAVEKERDFAATYEKNFGAHVVVADLADVIDGGGLGIKTDVVIGGPPCQGFSNLTGNKTNDPRRAMWRLFMDVVQATNCRVFVIENVPNILRSAEGHAIIDRARELKFHVGKNSSGVLTASNFGVPQNRRRAFIIGSKLGPIDLPTPDPRQRTISVREAFMGIPLNPTSKKLAKSPAIGPDLHIARNPTELSLLRYALIPQGGNRFDLQKRASELTPKCWIRKTSGGTDLFGRLEWDKPARCTIRCEFYKPEKGRYLHPSENRPITHWEAARLQTFPDEFQWCGTKIRIAMQIGNAVPPRLAEAVANSIMDHLREHNAVRSPRPSPAELFQIMRQWP